MAFSGSERLFHRGVVTDGARWAQEKECSFRRGNPKLPFFRLRNPDLPFPFPNATPARNRPDSSGSPRTKVATRTEGPRVGERGCRES